MKKINTYKSGFGLIEIVIGVTILSGALFSFSLFYQKALQVGSQTTELVQASFLLEEGVEAVKIIRDEGWQANIANLTTGTPIYLSFVGGTWATSTTNVYIKEFERYFVVDDVYRDVNDDIAVSGVLDAGTKKITVTVNWWSNISNTTSTKTITTYITDLFGD